MHDSKKKMGRDKPDLPCLLATYEGEGRKKEREGEREKACQKKWPRLNGSDGVISTRRAAGT